MATTYLSKLLADEALPQVSAFIDFLQNQTLDATRSTILDSSTVSRLDLSETALNAFLQANVTGPVLSSGESRQWTENLARLCFENQNQTSARDNAGVLKQLRQASLRYLDIDGVSPYAYIPHLELFALSKFLVDSISREASSQNTSTSSEQSESWKSLSWYRFRVNTWHFKLLSQPTLGSGSTFARSSQWIEVPTLAALILEDLEKLKAEYLTEEVWSDAPRESSQDEKTLLLVEAANAYIMLGRNNEARDTVKDAALASGFAYALSGALGKRTRFQVTDISQLVVLAKSRDASTQLEGDENHEDNEDARPDALQLNDDTVMEEIIFKSEQNGDTAKEKMLPAALRDMPPNEQPQLSPLDQIILLTEATIKDAFSPHDTITPQEILPYSVRVLVDKSTNWQIYTHALLVRSRIEVHRSRTVERGVLQLQAVADQVLTDTTADEMSAGNAETRATGIEESSATPSIQVTASENTQTATTLNGSTPTSFLPAPKPSESAPAEVRLRYIHALSTPPRWHLEAELAYAWAGIGSFVSALEIFKRLRLWAEVALCLASSEVAEDQDGRGSGGEEKAKGIIRWQLFQRTGESQMLDTDPDAEDIGGDVALLRGHAYSGPERVPPPPNAPRLWCILGDLENEPAHYQRGWDISQKRYARAQKSLGEHYIQQKDWNKAREAYKLATSVNRMSSEMWSRLGDISLRLGEFEEAAEAYNRALSSVTDAEGGEGAKTWSNMGSALWSLYLEVMAKKDDQPVAGTEQAEASHQDDLDGDTADTDRTHPLDPQALLARSLAAYKKGAAVAHDNWRIWDNVVTLSSRIQPPPVPDIILALKNIIRIRKVETTLDYDILAALLQDFVLKKEKVTVVEDGVVYEPPRGSSERLVIRLFEEDIVPIITNRAELWTLIARLRAWRNDLPGAVEATERAWRTSFGTSSSGLLPGAATPSSSDEAKSRDWTADATAWEDMVQRTDELVSAFENWGPQVEEIGTKWRGNARSAIRSVMGRGRETWEDSDGWKQLESLMEGLKVSR